MNPFSEKKTFLKALRNLNQKNNITCPNCKDKVTEERLAEHLYVCPICGHHCDIPAMYRIKTFVDPKSFREICGSIRGGNPLGFPGYDEKLADQRKKTSLREAVIVGTGRVKGRKAVICVMDNRFIMGSMGTAVGEKITRACEYATRSKLPLVIFCASGGARMQEGILSLFQMAKTSAAVARHSEEGLLHISVLTNPTTGGVTASFASLGDIILAEPKALIGFAGPRVIEQTIKQELPEGFQRAEYLQEHGFVDAIVNREQMRQKVGLLLKLHDRRARK